MLVETIAVGICGTDLEISAGEYGWAPPGHERLVLGHESIGKVSTAPSGSGLDRRGPRRRDRAAARPGPLLQLRPRRVGLLPQRPVRRARHQGARRLHARALSGRAGRSRQGRREARPARCAAGADERRGQGLGAGRAGRATAPTGSPGPPSSPAPARSACWRRSSACSEGSRSTSSTRSTDGIKPELVRGLGAQYHQGSIADACKDPDVVLECTGRRLARLRRHREHRPRRRRLPDRRVADRAQPRGRRRPREPRHGARQRGRSWAR